MTTEVPEASQIEKTKQQIRQLVSEIARLAESDASPDDFAAGFLGRTLAALAAPAGALWLRNEDGNMELAYQVNLQQVGLEHAGETAQRQHGMLLSQILANQRGVAVPAQSGGGETATDSAGNPTDFLIVAAPVVVDGESAGVVEVFHNPAAAPAVQQGYLRFLTQVSDLAGSFLKNRKLRGLVDRQHLWSRLEAFSRQVHTTLRVKTVAYTVANEGRRLIGCDRVSVALRHGKRVRIDAISGQDIVDKRANLTRLMANLADAVVFAGEPLTYTGNTEDLPPKIEETLQDYVDESNSKAIFIIPLHEPSDDGDRQAPSFGAVVVEQIEDDQSAVQLKELTEIVVRHSETALHNALRYQRVFLLPLWRWMGDQLGKLRGSGLAKFAAVVAVVAGLVCAMTFIKKDFRLDGTGKLMPANRRDVFASEAGTVSQIHIQKDPLEHGDQLIVKKDQLLLKLDNPDLTRSLQEAHQELTQAQNEYGNKRAQRDRGTGQTREEHIQLSGDMKTLLDTMRSLKLKIELLEKRHARLSVLSPMDGVVTTWDLYNRLQDRPVQQGSLLLSVADTRGSWVLEVMVPEDRIGHIIRAHNELKPGETLPVEYILWTNPEERFRGTLVEIGERGEMAEDEGNVVMIKVAPDPNNLPAQLRPGAEVRAGVICGRRALGYVLFHELQEAWYSRVVFFFGS